MMQNGTLPSPGSPPPYKISSAGYAVSGGAYTLALAPRDKVDYSVTKGGLRLWAVVFIFIVICSSLYTVFSAKQIFDIAVDLDGDGDLDGDVDDGDDEETLHAEKRLEKEREVKETPSRSPAERLSVPDRNQLQRSKEGETAEEEGEDDEKILEDGGEEEVEEEVLMEVEEQMLQALKEKADTKQKVRKEKREHPPPQPVEEVEEEEAAGEGEEVKKGGIVEEEVKKPRKRFVRVEKTVEEPKKISFSRTKGQPVQPEKEAVVEEVKEKAQKDSKEVAEDVHSTHAPRKVQMFRTKGLPAPGKPIQRPSHPEEVKESPTQKHPRLSKVERKEIETVKVFRTKGTQTKVPETLTISRRSEGGEEEKTCERGSPSCTKEVGKIRVYKTKGTGVSKPEIKSGDIGLVEEDEEEGEEEEEEEEEEEVVAVTRRPPSADAAVVHSHYRKHAITNREDNKIRNRLDDVDKLLDENYLAEAVAAVDKLVTLYPQSPRARYAKARSLDLLSERRQSNQLLEEAMKEYEAVLNLAGTPDALFKQTGDKLVERAKFRGWMQKALFAQKRLIDRFPDDLDIRNDYGVVFLMMGRNDDAKKVFQNVLQLDPSDGFAKVHLGFILKTVDNDMERGIRYLSEGIQSNATGTQDGKFYFHLGDAFQRVGRNVEAYDVYDKGVEKGLFLSRYQRSIYNVDGLKSRPWWSYEETTYEKYLIAIEKEWKVIRDEGLEVLDRKSGLFVSEDEKLTNTGDWKQFTLFQRGLLKSV